MKTPWIGIAASAVCLSLNLGCAATAEPTAPRASTDGASGASNGDGAASAIGGATELSGSGSSFGGSIGSAAGGSGTSLGGSATGLGGASNVAGTFNTAGTGNGAAGTLAGGGSGGAFNGTQTAVIGITSFSLTGCSQTVSVADLAAKNNGLTAPKPTQSFAAGTLNIDYTVPGQYGQVGYDFPAATGVDLTGCTLSVTLSASSWPPCGIYAVPFFYDGTLGLVAPYDTSAMKFVGEEVSNLDGAAATISFTALGTTLSKVGRVGLNIYDCPSSVTVGKL